MDRSSSQSRDVARLLERAAVRTFDLPVEKIDPTFDEVEVECLALVLSDNERIELRRRIAEWKMKLHCDRDAPFQKTQALHEAVRALGYTNLEVEGRVEIIYAEYCERQAQTQESRTLLLGLISKLDSALAAKDSEVYSDLKEASERILSRIDDATRSSGHETR